MKVHVVQQGECLSSIAAHYGFKTYRAIYDHPDNSAFRDRRPDPAVIFPGDQIFIPLPETKTLSLPTGKAHRIVLRLPSVRIRVRLLDRDGTAIANQDYTIRYPGGEKSGRTDDDGLLDQKVPASISEAEVNIPALGVSLRLKCGLVDPIDTPTGIQARLNNLGFAAGAVDGILGPRSQEALRRFQEERHLDVSGAVDDQTQQELVTAYGC